MAPRGVPGGLGHIPVPDNRQSPHTGVQSAGLHVLGSVHDDAPRIEFRTAIPEHHRAPARDASPPRRQPHQT
jgi:hypothetical protein